MKEEFTTNTRRWYDRDPVLSSAMKTLEESDDETQIKIALNLIKIITEHNISNSEYESVEDIAARYNGQGYGTFKKAVADVVCGELETLQNKVKEIQSSGIIDKVLEDGANKASYYARKKLSKVCRKVGLR